MTAPVLFRWDGDNMVPLPHFHNVVNAEYTVGAIYPLAPVGRRSQASHNHYFAAVNEAWLNLPEHIAPSFPTSEHLRKYALIKGGYHDQRSIVAGSKAEAQRIAAFIRPCDEFAVVTVSEATVTVHTAKSQSMRAMGAKQFQESKEAVLGVLADMIGTEPGHLRRNAGQAA